jgi:hypothetical protein
MRESKRASVPSKSLRCGHISLKNHTGTRPTYQEMSLPGMVDGVRGSPSIKRPVAFDNMTSPFDVDVSVSKYFIAVQSAFANPERAVQTERQQSTAR